MARIEWLTYEHFAGRVGERFDVTAGDGEGLALELVDATQGSEPGGRGPDGQERLQFAVVFRGPADRVLPQGIRTLAHPELAELDLFLVPIGPDAEGMRYEAAFA